MIKNEIIIPEPTTTKEIRHIIKMLYKIKTIDRRTDYLPYELRKLVFNSAAGQEVMKRLQDKEISLEWLKDNGYSKIAEVFQYVLNEK
jgi:predicted nuclease of restriction endonuclease-like RecB superfamily